MRDLDPAVRREMKRVWTDLDFEPLPANHPVLETFFKLQNIPPGMNSRREPVEIIKIKEGKDFSDLCVFYTPNEYNKLWKTESNNQISPEELAAYKFGANAVCYFPVRFQYQKDSKKIDKNAGNHGLLENCRICI